jgi:Ca2+-binding RTX toxin-like protein
MARPHISILYGEPIAYPWDALYRPLWSGELQPPTANEFVLTDGDSFRVVFEGNFTVVGGDVTGGTVTGFSAFAGSTKMVEGAKFEIEAAALFDSLETTGSPFLYFDMIFGRGIKWIGSQFDDQWLSGDDFNDKILGLDGNDTLYGYDGNDLIKGGKGNDLLSGDDGFDRLYGNAGKDVFEFYLNPEYPRIGFDKIMDFKVGHDLIGLRAFGLLPGLLDPKYFHRGTEAETESQVIIYDKSTGRLFFDVDGIGIEAQLQFAKVKPGTKLHAHDFMVEDELA